MFTFYQYCLTKKETLIESRLIFLKSLLKEARALTWAPMTSARPPRYLGHCSLTGIPNHGSKTDLNVLIFLFVGFWSAFSVSCMVFYLSFRSGKIIDWVCANDKTTMYISEEGRLRCQNNTHNDLIINWKFDCGDRVGPHRGTHFRSADYEGFNHAISMALYNSTWTTAEWAIKLMQNVKRQFNRNWSSPATGSVFAFLWYKCANTYRKYIHHNCMHSIVNLDCSR